MPQNIENKENQIMLIMNQAAIQKLDQIIAEIPYKYADQIYKSIIPYITEVQKNDQQNQEQKENLKKSSNTNKP